MERKEGLQDYYDKCTKQIEDIVELVRGQLTTMARITLGALIVIDVHGRELEPSNFSSKHKNILVFLQFCINDKKLMLCVLLGKVRNFMLVTFTNT